MPILPQPSSNSSPDKEAAAKEAAASLLRTQQISRIIPDSVTPQQMENILQQLKKTMLEHTLGAEINRRLSLAPHAALLASDASRRLMLPQWPAPAARAEGSAPQPPAAPINVNVKITALYAGGMSVREIQGVLREQGEAKVSPERIGSVVEEAMAGFSAWSARQLQAVYPIVFFDALPVMIRQYPIISPKAMYLALGVLPDGSHNVLGLWIGNTESTAFWTEMLNGLKARGVQDILIAVTDGIQAAADAIGAVYPATTLQVGIAHLMRNSLDYVPEKEHQALAAAITPIYAAASAQAAQAALRTLESGPWGLKFPMVANAWVKAWEHVAPFFAFPPEIRRVIYTANAFERVNSHLRKAIKTHRHFLSDGAALKLAWLALAHITEDWGRAANHWKAARDQFAVLYGQRLALAGG